MKKIIYAAIAAIGLWLSPGCSNEEELLGSGDEAQVSFTVNLADGIQTKAADDQIAQGLKAKNLVVGVFEKNGEEYQEVAIRHKKDGAFTVGEDGKIKANVNFKLMKGKSYSFIFWAQSQSVETTVSSPYYDLTDLQDIKVSYAGAKANDESRDAFLGVVKDYEVTGNFTKDVPLKRPFAQLNFMVTKGELNKAKAAGLIIEKSSITLSQVAQKLQPLKGTVSEYQENVTFEARNVSIDMNNITDSENKQTLPTYEGSSETTYYYLATTYFLVAAGTTDAENSGKERATLTSANMKIKDAEGNGLTANSVPVQWNYRTNIYGPLLTAPGTFIVEIKEGFYGDYNEYQESVTVDAISKVAQAIKDGATTITVKDAPTGDEIITIPKVADGKNKNITLNLPVLTSKITINEASSGAADETIPAKVNVNTTSADNVVIELPSSTVTLNGGRYTAVTSTTYDETLIVSEGVTITNLQVMKGKVRIMKGGKVGTITRAVGNQDATTYVDIEDGGILETNPTDGAIEVLQSISTAEGLKAFAAAVNGGNSYSGQTVVLSADIDLSGKEWTSLDFGSGATITINGNGKTIKNLNQPLVRGTSGIELTIKDLTIEDANVGIGYENGLGTGAFISYIDNSGKATFENCHLIHSTVTGKERAAALISYSTGSEISIKDCSVESCTIKAVGGAGGLIGYTSATTTIINSKVENTQVEATEERDAGKAAVAGAVMGTVGGSTTFTNVTVKNNIVKNHNAAGELATLNEYVGRVVDPGTLTVNE